MVKSWHRIFQKGFATAKPAIQGGHSHRFRDTFAVTLLLYGVSIEFVSKLLGHSPIKVTERHYSLWVKARQDPSVNATTCRLPHEPASTTVHGEWLLFRHWCLLCPGS